jgi:hypothetical protein
MSNKVNYTSEAIELLTAFGDLVERCPGSSLLSLLKRIQEGFGVWVNDTSHLIETKVIPPNRI